MKPATFTQLRAIRDLAARGWSIYDIGDLIGLAHVSVSRLIKKHGYRSSYSREEYF